MYVPILDIRIHHHQTVLGVKDPSNVPTLTRGRIRLRLLTKAALLQKLHQPASNAPRSPRVKPVARPEFSIQTPSVSISGAGALLCDRSQPLASPVPGNFAARPSIGAVAASLTVAIVPDSIRRRFVCRTIAKTGATAHTAHALFVRLPLLLLQQRYTTFVLHPCTFRTSV